MSKGVIYNSKSKMYTLYLFTENPALKSLYLEKMMKDENRGDAGIDLYVPQNTIITKESSTFLNHEVICRMTRMTKTNDVDNVEIPVSYYLYPRSSISKTPLRLANSVGIIDAGYRGNIIAALDCIRDDYKLEQLQRIVQICAPTLEPVRLVVCDSLEEMNMNTLRSSGGFGSTGK